MYSDTYNNSPHRTDYEDLGQVITATNMAAGATVYSNWFDNVQWARNILFLSQSDQQYDIGHERRDTALPNSGAYAVYTQTANAALIGSWKPNPVSSSNSSGNSILGYSIRFVIKNSSASANTFANLRVQLMGV